MADYLIQDATAKEICDNIREKTNTTDIIKVKDINSKIDDVYLEKYNQFWRYTLRLDNPTVRSNYRQLFAEGNWTDEMFNDIMPPPTDEDGLSLIRPIDCRYLFQNTTITTINFDKNLIDNLQPKRDDETDDEFEQRLMSCANRRHIDWSYWSKQSKAPGLRDCFRDSQALKNIAITFYGYPQVNFLNAFTGCSGLVNVIFDQVRSSIPLKVINPTTDISFIDCPLLSRASIINILKRVCKETSSRSITFNEEAVKNAFPNDYENYIKDDYVPVDTPNTDGNWTWEKLMSLDNLDNWTIVVGTKTITKPTETSSAAE